MAIDLVQYLRDNVLYSRGYLSGRASALPQSFSDVYAQVIAKGTWLVTLPLPFLSALAIPYFGGSSTTLNLVFFYAVWAALVTSYGELSIQIYGTLILRLCCFVGPALVFLAWDLSPLGRGRAGKAQGNRHHPKQLGRNRILSVVGVALFNVLFAVALQGAIEFLFVNVLHLRSLIQVSALRRFPAPWTIGRNLIGGFLVRGIAHYSVHRWALHTYDGPLKTWHLSWQHSIFPFSLVAAYDHPVTYLLAQWMPTILPAYLFRWHVLTWFIFVALTSLQELFVYSGYTNLPSAIMLPGMSRRMEAHFESVRRTGRPGNFGYFGVLDVVCRSTCEEEDTVFDDLQHEAIDRRVEEKTKILFDKFMKEVNSKQNGRNEDGDNQGNDVVDDDAEYVEEDEDATVGGSSALSQISDQVAKLAPRRSGRKRGR